MFRLTFFILMAAISSTAMAQTALNGIHTSYYHGQNFDTLVVSRTEFRPGFTLFYQSPAPGVRAQDFSVRWTGKLMAPTDGEYTFVLAADDGIRFWFGGKLLIDEWHLQQQSTYSSPRLILKAGKYYDLTIEYYNHELHAVMNMSWQMHEKARKVMGLELYTPEEKIPTEYFFTKEPGVKNKQTASQKKYTKPAKSQGQTTVNTEAITRIKPSASESSAKPETKKKTILKNVLFEQSTSLLLPESYVELDKLTNVLKKYVSYNVLIEGHTDNQGDQLLNQKLSEERAKAVGNYLIGYGIDKKRIVTKGWGGQFPIAINGTEAYKNRRVEFTFEDTAP